MITEALFEKIRLRMGSTPEIRLAKARARSIEFNKRLEEQMEAQKMTPELLNKRCTL